MGGYGSLGALNAHRVAQAQSLVAAYGSEDVQRARGTATAVTRIRSTGVSGGRTEAAEAKAQAGTRERLAELAKQKERREAAAQGSSDDDDPYASGPAARWRCQAPGGR